MAYWLVQRALLTMVACSNDQWQRSKIQQCKLEGGARYVNQKIVYTQVQFTLFHYKT